MWFIKKKVEEVKPVEPYKEEIEVSNLLTKIGLLDIQQMLKDCEKIMGQKDLEQLEFLLSLIKPVLKERLLKGFTFGEVSNLELDYEKYRVPTISQILYNKHGLKIQLRDNGET